MFHHSAQLPTGKHTHRILSLPCSAWHGFVLPPPFVVANCPYVYSRLLVLYHIPLLNCDVVQSAFTSANPVDPPRTLCSSSLLRLWSVHRSSCFNWFLDALCMSHFSVNYLYFIRLMLFPYQEPVSPTELCSLCSHPWYCHVVSASLDHLPPECRNFARSGTFDNMCGGFFSVRANHSLCPYADFIIVLQLIIPWHPALSCVCGKQWSVHGLPDATLSLSSAPYRCVAFLY